MPARKVDSYSAEQVRQPPRISEQGEADQSTPVRSSRRGDWAVGLSAASIIAYLLAWAIDADSDEMFSAALYFLPIWFFAGIAGLVVGLSALTKGPRNRELGLVALGLVPVNILVFVLSLWRGGG